VKRHSVKQMEQVQQANVGVGLVCVLTRVCENQAAASAIQVGGSAVFAKNSRSAEVQADEGGFRSMIVAGINPRGMLTFFQKLLADEQSSGGGGANAWFSDHPGTQDRIADIQRMLDATPASQIASLRTDSPQFQQMKQRLAQLPAAPAPRQ
jgi:predicted Zn-dependent protease